MRAVPLMSEFNAYMDTRIRRPLYAIQILFKAFVLVRSKHSHDNIATSPIFMSCIRQSKKDQRNSLNRRDPSSSNNSNNNICNNNSRIYSIRIHSAPARPWAFLGPDDVFAWDCPTWKTRFYHCRYRGAAALLLRSLRKIWILAWAHWQHTPEPFFEQQSLSESFLAA